MHPSDAGRRHANNQRPTFDLSKAVDSLYPLLSKEDEEAARNAGTITGWIRVTYELPEAVVSTAGNGTTKVSRRTSVAITNAQNAWEIFYRRGDLVKANRGRDGDTVEEFTIQCSNDGRFRSYRYDAWIGIIGNPAAINIRITDSIPECPDTPTTLDRVINLQWTGERLSDAALVPTPEEKKKMEEEKKKQEEQKKNEKKK
jgi:hypothetical protein